jgi:hypothetical protein
LWFMLIVLGWILFIAGAAALIYWIIVVARAWTLLSHRPNVRAGLDLPAPAQWPRLSVIVPAHNEERAIDTCARSLREQTYVNLEIIFVLDRCTDRTLEILQSHVDIDSRLVIIENSDCPEDWAGKCNAARLGAERASGGWLLFTDADTQFEPELCRAAVALALHRHAAMLSLLSSLRFQHAHERVVQPVAAMNLVRMYPYRRTRSSRKVRPFANGQFMLFDRSWYERLGGHAAVKDDLLEDLAFARRLQELGSEAVVVLSDGMLRCSMYDTPAALREGWKRIFIEACQREPARLRTNAWRVLASGVLAPALQAVGLIVGGLLASGGETALGSLLIATVFAGWIVQAATLARIYRASGAPLRASLAFPLGSWIVGRLMLEGARDLIRRRPVRWGGRQYVLKPRA